MENEFQLQDKETQAKGQGVDLPRVQARLLEMGKTITEVLERNEIPYVITFGTLLGAVRHGGFIPWDDDFDLFLFDDTYDQGIAVLRRGLTSDLFVEDAQSEAKYFHGWAHVKDLRSEVHCSQYPLDSFYNHHGLSVDLYRCKKMPLRDLKQYRLAEANAYLKRMHAMGLLTDDELISKLETLAARIEEDERGNEDVPDPVLGMPVKERYMRCVDVFPLKRYAFGDAEFWGPQNADAILRHFYGDYMVLPVKEDRVPHYDHVEFLG